MGTRNENNTEVLLVRANSERRTKMVVSLSKTLNDLKKVVAQTFGIPVEHQRLFHLGRELKTRGRSLESLGVGKMSTDVIHVLQNTVSTTSHSKGSTTTQEKKRDGRVVNLCDDDDDDACIVFEQSASKRHRAS